MTTGINLAYNQYTNSAAQIEADKRTLSEHYPIVTASFHSPQIIIETKTLNEFLLKADIVNATDVYVTNNEGYVVIDNNFKYAYNLQIPQPTIDMAYLAMIAISIIVMVAVGWFWFIFRTLNNWF